MVCGHIESTGFSSHVYCTSNNNKPPKRTLDLGAGVVRPQIHLAQLRPCMTRLYYDHENWFPWLAHGTTSLALYELPTLRFWLSVTEVRSTHYDWLLIREKQLRFSNGDTGATSQALQKTAVTSLRSNSIIICTWLGVVLLLELLKGRCFDQS